jgi:formylglycine-generating enzyme required for sulfatase activity
VERRDSYTRYPRAILWLVREGRARVGGGEPDAEPPFERQVGSFYLSKLPVTNRQYEVFDAAHRRPGCSAGDDDPATGVTLEGARAYCDWYARVSRKPMRLPTEVEWEYACRAGASTRYFFGDDPERGDSYVWDAWNSGDRIPPLKAKRPNAFGLLGMLGGVWEWTGSRYLPYPLPDGEPDDAAAAELPHVLRGGSFRVPRERLGCAVRRPAEPGMELDDVGFRIARSL